MKKIVLVCASLLATVVAGSADAATVRFSGVVRGSTTPFTITFGAASGFIDGEIGDGGSFDGENYFGEVYSNQNMPTINIGNQKYDNIDLVALLLQQRSQFLPIIQSETSDGWIDDSQLNYSRNIAGPKNADLISGQPYITAEIQQSIFGYLEKIEYSESLDEFSSVKSYNYYVDQTFSLSLNFTDAYGDAALMSQRRQIDMIGDTLVYEFLPGSHWEAPTFVLEASGVAFFSDDFETNYSLFDTVRVQGDIARMEVGQLGSMTMPIMPTAITPGGGFVFVQPVLANTPTFFDPPVSIGYDYAVGVSDPLITKAMFPTLLGDLDGFDIFALGGGGPALFSNVMGGQWVDFTSIGYANGISGFSLRDINPALELDPANPTAFVTGLEFATSGTVNLTQTPVTIEWPIPGGGGGGTVPEPASWAMLIAGFGLTGAAMRRRRVPVAG